MNFQKASSPLPGIDSYKEAIRDIVLETEGEDNSKEGLDVYCDSRKIDGPAVFVAVRGEKTDGHSFVRDAVKRGAAAIVHEDSSVSVPKHLCRIKVSDSYLAYALLSEHLYSYPANALKLAGITGTNGKTTCTYLLRKILDSAGFRTGMINTVCSSWPGNESTSTRTTPDAKELQARLAEFRQAACSHAVLEISSHGLRQHRTGSMLFDVALFTNLSSEHLDYHGDMKNYFMAKKRLFDEAMKAKAAACINTDDPYGLQLAEKCACARLISYGRNEKANCRITEFDFSSAGTRLVLDIEGKIIKINSALVGEYNALNLAAAAAAGTAFGVSPEKLAEALSGPVRIPGRLEPFRTNNNISFFVDYPHTDDALAKVLSVLRTVMQKEHSNGLLHVVFGCGGDRDKSKRPRMGAAAAKFANKITITNDNPRSENPQKIISEILSGIPKNHDCRIITDRRRAIRDAAASARPGDVILVAGKGHEQYQQIAGKSFPFDDSKEIICASILADHQLVSDM